MPVICHNKTVVLKVTWRELHETWTRHTPIINFSGVQTRFR